MLQNRLSSRERLRRVLRKKAAVVIQLLIYIFHIFTPADLHLLTLTCADLLSLTSADLHLLTFTSADLLSLTSADLRFLTSADLHLLTFTSDHVYRSSLSLALLILLS